MRNLFFYQKIYYHVVGTSQSEDRLIYERQDQKEWNFETVVSEDGAYLIVYVWTGFTQNNLVFCRDLRTNSRFIELIPNFKARYIFLGNDGRVFWFHTDAGAPRGRVIAIDTTRPSPESWREIIPESSQILRRRG